MAVFRGTLPLFLCFCVCVSGTTWLINPSEDSGDIGEDEYDTFYRNIIPRQNVILVGVPEENFGGMLNQGPLIPDETGPATVSSKTPLDILSEKVDALTSEVKSQHDQIKALENSNENIVKKIDEIEQQTKVNNLIFTNVRENNNENYKTTLQKVLQVINRMLRIRLNSNEISVALRVDSENFNKTRPIVVKFTKFADKMKVLAARSRLKKSNIDISSDYSDLVNLRRKELIPFLLEKRRQGHNAFLLYDKLVVDGVKLSLDELKDESRREEVEEALEKEPPVEETTSEQPPESDQEPDEQVEEVEADTQFQDESEDYS